MRHSGSNIKRIFVILAAAIFLVGIATPAGLLVWQATSASAALLEGSAGTLVSTTVDHSILIGNTFTRVDTSTGSVVVHGVFSGPHGVPLLIDQFNKRTRLRLCIPGRSAACAPLAGVWAGPLAPTAAARTVVNFQRYGMTSSHLANWLALGVVAVLIVVLIGVPAFLSCDDDDACTQPTVTP